MMDPQDQAILDILRSDGRATIRSISEALGVPESTARDRVRSLEERNIIEGYRVNVDAHRLGLRITAWLLVEVADDDVNAFAHFMDGQPHVLRGYQLAKHPRSFALKVASGSTRQLTTEVQNWRRKFRFTTRDLILVDELTVEDSKADDVDSALRALDERLIV